MVPGEAQQAATAACGHPPLPAPGRLIGGGLPTPASARRGKRESEERGENNQERRKRERGEELKKNEVVRGKREWRGEKKSMEKMSIFTSGPLKRSI